MSTLENFLRLTLIAAALALNQTAKAAAWTYTGSLKTASLFHTTTLLPNGKVLVAGGQAASGVTNRAELFHPATGTWTNAGAMSTDRLAHTATLLLNGKVLVAGGWAKSGFTNALASAELYDPATGSWTNIDSMITRRAYHQAVLLPTGNVLVTGGAGDNLGIIKSAEVYDPSTGTWTATGTMKTNRAGFAAVLLSNGNVLAAGGQPVRDIALASAELYNPSNGIWTVTSSMAHERADFTMTVLSNGNVLAVGGWDNTYLPANTELYDPFNGTWTVTGVLNNTRYHTRATLLQNGKVLIAGGEVYDNALSSSEFGFTSVPIPGAAFTVYSATNVALPSSNWAALGGVTDNLPGQFQFTDLQATSNKLRFYRVRSP